LHQRVGIVLREGVLMVSEKNARSGAKGISQHTHAGGPGLSRTVRTGDHRDPLVGVCLKTVKARIRRVGKGAQLLPSGIS
jgi:hypothetical protein